MGLIKRQLIEDEERGLLEFNDSKGYYEPTELGRLVELKEFLEWEISSSKSELREVVKKINNYKGVRQ